MTRLPAWRDVLKFGAHCCYLPGTEMPPGTAGSCRGVPEDRELRWVQRFWNDGLVTGLRNVPGGSAVLWAEQSDGDPGARRSPAPPAGPAPRRCSAGVTRCDPGPQQRRAPSFRNAALRSARAKLVLVTEAALPSSLTL